MGISLIQRVSDANAVLRIIEEAGGELTPDVEHELMKTDFAVQDKVDGYDTLITKANHTADWYETQAEGYAKTAKQLRQFTDRLRNRMKEVMLLTGITEFKGQTVRYRLIERAPKLVIWDRSTLPTNCTKQVTEVVPDKELITAKLKDQLDVPGAMLERVYALCKFVNKGDA